jgi:hypothetical protein
LETANTINSTGGWLMFAVRVPSVKSVHVHRFAKDWSQLRARLLEHVERADKFAGDLYSPVTYAEGAKRGNAGVLQVNALVIDLDGEALDVALPNIAHLEFVAYTTFSHKADDPHWHLVLQLASPVPACDWSAVWHGAHQQIGLGGDIKTKDVARIFFLPQHAPDSVHQTLVNSGDWFVPVRGVVPVRKQSHTDHVVVRVPDSFWDEPCDDSWRAGLDRVGALRLARERLAQLRM